MIVYHSMRVHFYRIIFMLKVLKYHRNFTTIYNEMENTLGVVVHHSMRVHFYRIIFLLKVLKYHRNFTRRAINIRKADNEQNMQILFLPDLDQHMPGNPGNQ